MKQYPSFGGMKRYTLIIILVILLAWLLWQLPGAHAQGPITPPPPTPQPPITQSDVDALQRQANMASANLNSAQAGLAQAQANYNAAASSAAQARALADEADQRLKIQQTAQAVELATQARERSDQADRELSAAALTLKDAQAQIQQAQQQIDEMAAALLNAHAAIQQRDQTIAEQGHTIDLQNRQIESDRQYREQTNTLIVLLAFDVVIAASIALIIMRWYQSSKRLVYQPVEKSTAPELNGSRLPDQAPAVVSDQATMDHIHSVYENEP